MPCARIGEALFAHRNPHLPPARPRAPIDHRVVTAVQCAVPTEMIYVSPSPCKRPSQTAASRVRQGIQGPCPQAAAPHLPAASSSCHPGAVLEQHRKLEMNGSEGHGSSYMYMTKKSANTTPRKANYPPNTYFGQRTLAMIWPVRV